MVGRLTSQHESKALSLAAGGGALFACSMAVRARPVKMLSALPPSRVLSRFDSSRPLTCCFQLFALDVRQLSRKKTQAALTVKQLHADWQGVHSNSSAIAQDLHT